MSLDEIEAAWAKDSVINSLELGDEALKIPQLHSKYWKMLVRENFRLMTYQNEYDVLKLEKREFYTLGPTEEQIKKGWKLPPRGMILKNEVEPYLQADPDLIKASQNIGSQREKIKLLESIINNLNSRSFFIKNKIEFEKFRNGVI